MEDIENGSYLKAGGIWAELNRRKSFSRLAAIKKALNSHITKTLYEQNREAVLQLIGRKISYKEHLIKRHNEEFSQALHKSITSVEVEISTLLAFVKSFDAMVEFMQNETAEFVDEWYKVQQQNLILSQLLDAQTERASTWCATAFNLHDHILNQQAHA